MDWTSRMVSDRQASESMVMLVDVVVVVGGTVHLTFTLPPIQDSGIFFQKWNWFQVVSVVGSQGNLRNQTLEEILSTF